MADMAAELEAAAVRLRRAGQGLERELTAAMRRAAQPVPGQVRDGLKPHLPDRYAADLGAGVDIKTIVRNSGGDAVVSVYAKAAGKARKLRNLDEGRLTHPVYGNREHWPTQEEPSVQPGIVTGPCEAGGPRVRAGIERALADVADKAVK